MIALDLDCGRATFTGPVTVPAPTDAAHAVRKQDLDAAIAGVGGSTGSSGFEEDGNGDLMPSNTAPGSGGDFELDGNGDLQPSA